MGKSFWVQQHTRVKSPPVVACAVLCAGCSFPEYQFDDELFSSLSAPEDAGMRAATTLRSTAGTAGMAGSAGGGGGSGSSADASAPMGTGGEVSMRVDSGVGGSAAGSGSGTSGSGAGGESIDAGSGEACDGRCVGVPGGWTGPIAVWTGAPVDAPACSGEYSTVAFSGNSGIVAPDAECPACSCDADALSCGDAELYFYEEAMCPDPVSSQGAEASYAGDTRFLTSEIDVCFGLDPLTSDQAAGARFTVAGGTCSPVATGSAQAEDYSWQTAMVACSPEDDLPRTCGGGLSCAPLEPSPFAALCIARTGLHDCPSAYPGRSLYYRDADDTRSCSACECGVAECDGSFELYADVECNTTPTEVAGLVDNCSLFAPGPNQGGGFTTGGIYRGGSVECVASGGESTGRVTATDPVTVCCP